MRKQVRTLPLILAVALGAFGYAILAPTLSRAGDEHADHAGHGAPAKNTANWTPVNKMHLYLCAFHVAKENPSFQVEAHHYCSPQGEKLHQCVIYDSHADGAKLLGVEYIVPDAVYQALPDAEKKYWHPHAYEIVSGQLIAPDMPNEGDDIFPGLITTWGKTWHTWRDPATDLPLGEPILMWSANGDGQIADSLVTKSDSAFGISTAKIRERRRAMGFAVPNLPPPATLNDVGRRWTTTGPDEPQRHDAAGH